MSSPRKRRTARAVLRAKRIASGDMSEDEIQIEVAKRLREAGVPFFHVANERRTTPRQGAKLKAMGVSAGVPDIIAVMPAAVGRGPFALELKTERGRLSDAQRNWLETLQACGWQTACTYGLREAMDRLQDWGLIK